LRYFTLKEQSFKPPPLWTKFYNDFSGLGNVTTVTLPCHSNNGLLIGVAGIDVTIDEFDVFMDSVHRKVSMNLLLQTAKEFFKQRQLIMITPHDVSNVKRDDQYLRIIKLLPPKRDANQIYMDEFMTSHQ
jgi:hypothetical protein